MSKKSVSVGVIKAQESECSKDSMIIAGSVCKFFTHPNDDSEYSAACCRYLDCRDLVRVKINDGYELVFASSAHKELERDENGDYVVDESNLNMVAMFILKHQIPRDMHDQLLIPAVFGDVIVMRKDSYGAYVDACMDDFVSKVSVIGDDVVSLDKLTINESCRDKFDDTLYKMHKLPKFSNN